MNRRTHLHLCLCALIGACLSAPVATGATTTGPVVHPASGHAYYTIEAWTTWDEAQAWAVSLGGHLVAINDAGEDLWLRDNLGLAGGYYWLGADDVAVEGTFAWVTGEPFLYQDFLPGEPDDDAGIGGNADHLALSAATWDWLDTNGSFAGFVSGAIAEVAPASAVEVGPMNGTIISFEARPSVADSHMQLHFSLAREASVSCRIFDLRGRHVRQVVDSHFAAGVHQLAWDVRDDFARRVHSGTYLVQLRVDGASRLLKIAVMH